MNKQHIILYTLIVYNIAIIASEDVTKKESYATHSNEKARTTIDAFKKDPRRAFHAKRLTLQHLNPHNTNNNDYQEQEAIFNQAQEIAINELLEEYKQKMFNMSQHINIREALLANSNNQTIAECIQCEKNLKTLGLSTDETANSFYTYLLEQYTNPTRTTSKSQHKKIRENLHAFGFSNSEIDKAAHNARQKQKEDEALLQSLDPHNVFGNNLRTTKTSNNKEKRIALIQEFDRLNVQQDLSDKKANESIQLISQAAQLGMTPDELADNTPLSRKKQLLQDIGIALDDGFKANPQDDKKSKQRIALFTRDLHRRLTGY